MNVIVFHGTLGSPEINWFPWFKEMLQARNIRVDIPALPTPENQNPEAWLAVLADQDIPVNEETVVIGHSCGATLLLSLLEKYGPVRQAVFVSVVTEAVGNDLYDGLNAPFISRDYNYERIRKNAGVLSILHGDDDPYVPLEQPIELAKKLDVDVQVIQGGGHLNGESGYTQFPLLTELLKLDS